jgi:ribonuclease R
MARKKQSAGKPNPNHTASSNVPGKSEIAQRVIKVLKSSIKKSLNIRQIQSRIKAGISIQYLEEVMNDLVNEKKVEHLGGFRFKIFVQAETYEGRYEMTRDNYGIVHVDALGEDIFVIEAGSAKALHGDLVRIKIVDKGKRFVRGRILEIIERKQTRFAGTIDTESKNVPFFIPQNSKLRIEFTIPERNLNGAKHNDKVVVELVRWQTEKPVGKVVEILGAGGEHFAEMNAIMMEFGLSDTFPPEVQAFADQIPHEVSQDEIAKRRDFRGILTFTIDPFDAKDFDDALSYRILDNGNYEVGIHIADVTHYLQEGTILDKEAYERATSVYLVDRTIPMLPEVLSNDLCSLVPNKDRLTYSAVFELDADGKIINEWFGRTIIHSQRRFTYEEVQQTIETQVGEYADEILTLNRLAYKLRDERFAKGSINFETEEVKFKLDEKGIPLAVYHKERKDAHKLIEDFMLLANRRVALYVAKKKRTNPIPFIYRVHATPDYDRLKNLQKFVSLFGYTLNLKSEKGVSNSINQLVSEVENKPEQNIIQSVAIRSMPKAIYTSENIGHYGLGFEYYTHFTSPIRRYPDVMAHRILDQVLNSSRGKPLKIDPDQLERACKHCSERERNAADAERASIKYKQVEYMEQFINQTFDGLISGLTEKGIYVEIDESHCEGMIPLREMKDDHYNLDDTGYRLIGNYTRKVYTLGERVRIKVVRTNLVKRQVDFILIGKVSELTEKPKQRQRKIDDPF